MHNGLNSDYFSPINKVARIKPNDRFVFGKSVTTKDGSHTGRYLFMAMIVQHNIASINTNRQLGISTTNLSKNTEKLSSGYRINRAADDAAGLAISEKMRSQIRGLNQASAKFQ